MLLGAGPKDGYAVGWIDLLPLLTLVVSFGAAHVIFALLGFRGDQLVLAIIALLCGSACWRSSAWACSSAIRSVR